MIDIKRGEVVHNNPQSKYPQPITSFFSIYSELIKKVPKSSFFT